jgi:aminopeptidase N
VFEGILRSMNRWAVSTSDQGAIHLGYRLGHIKNNPKILRALVYNKAAMVLHMARQLVGDEAFFRTLRRFYAEHRFQKAGTDQLRLAFEAETGRSFSRFFDRWIYGAELPSLAFSSRVEGSGDAQVLILRFEQGDTVFDFPVSVTLQLADGTSREIVVPITDKLVEYRVPLPGRLRGVLVNRDRGALIKGD